MAEVVVAARMRKGGMTARHGILDVTESVPLIIVTTTEVMVGLIVAQAHQIKEIEIGMCECNCNIAPNM